LDLARYLVDAVVLERRSCRDVARAHRVSKSWVAKLVARYRAGGYEAIAPRSKAAKRVANRSSAELEDRVVSIRKELSDKGFDAGAHTIHYHLTLSDPSPPSLSTI
jgi:transposase